MNKKSLWLFTIFFVGAVAIAEAQQPAKVPRIVYLSNISPTADAARYEAFRQGLRELGYVGEKTLLLSIDLQRESLIASRRLRPR